MTTRKRRDNKNCKKSGSVPENITGWVLAFSITGVIMVSATTSYAGFSWTPPPTQTQHSGPIINPLPAMDVEVETMIEQASGTKETATLTKEYFTEEKPLAMGFGRDMPLAFALHQIVPSEYAYSFDQDVSQAARINWDGGKPWDVVLQESLSPSGLMAEITGNVVRIRWGTPNNLTEDPSMMENELFPNEFSPVVPVVKADTQEEILYTSPSPASERQPLSYHPYNTQAETTHNPTYPRHQPSRVNTDWTVTNKPQLLDKNLYSYESQDAVPALYKTADFTLTSTGTPMPLTVSPATPEPYYAHGRVMDPYEIRFWQAKKDASLRNTLTEWSELAGVRMFWETRYDYRLPATVQMHGTFPDAVTEVLSIYTTTRQRPLGRLHPNLPEGPSVLIIENHVSTE